MSRPGRGSPDRIDDADVEIGANVKAKRLRFDRRPKTKVEGESASERENLPDEVEPGVTYKDVRVRWRSADRVDGSGR